MYRRFDAAAGGSNGTRSAGQRTDTRHTGTGEMRASGMNKGGQDTRQQESHHAPNRQGGASNTNNNQQSNRRQQGNQYTADADRSGASTADNRQGSLMRQDSHKTKMGQSGVLNTDNRQNSTHHNDGQHTQKGDGCDKMKQSQKTAKSTFLKGILPTSVYDPKSKKILGILSAEDLLLVALIFLFLEKDDGDNTIMVLALIYVLISDYIDLPDFAL